MNNDDRLGADAVEAMCSYATAALPHETGGILLGFRSDAGVHATDALHIPDRRARRARYRRSHRLASRALKAALANERPGSPVGYVGEWHSHPAPVGPSSPDLGEMRDVRRLAADTVLLVVLMRQPEGWRLHFVEMA